MQGTVIFLKSFLGTKSESVQPFLYLGNGEIIRIFKPGDNPFENETLQNFDGKEVAVSGEVNEKGILEISSIGSVVSLCGITDCAMLQDPDAGGTVK